MTRRSFRRKLIMFGVSVFASLAITATGFATWVLSADASRNTEGGIEIASVSDASISIENLAFLDTNGQAPITNFKFEPAKDDDQGRVKTDGEFEDMDIRIGWTIENYEYVASTFIEFKIPEGVYNAMQKGYLELPSSFARKNDSNGLHVIETVDSVNYYVYQFNAPAITASGNTPDELLSWTVSGENVDFILTLKFNWGDAFANTNPSIYYDQNAEGLAADFDTVKATLIDIKATIFGLTEQEKQSLFTMRAEEQDAFYATKVAPRYKVVIHATVR